MNPQENLVTKKLDFSEADQFFKTIGDVSAEIGIPPHVLRFWESKFLNIKPHKRKGGHRYYSKVDVDAIYQIKKLLYEEGYTIKGAQRFLREKGYMGQGTSEEQNSLFTEEKPQPAIAGSAAMPQNSNFQPDLLESAPNTAEKVDSQAFKMLLKELELIKRTLEKK